MTSGPSFLGPPTRTLKIDDPVAGSSRGIKVYIDAATPSPAPPFPSGSTLSTGTATPPWGRRAWASAALPAGAAHPPCRQTAREPRLGRWHRGGQVDSTSLVRSLLPVPPVTHPYGAGLSLEPLRTGVGAAWLPGDLAFVYLLAATGRCGARGSVSQARLPERPGAAGRVSLGLTAAAEPGGVSPGAERPPLAPAAPPSRSSCARRGPAVTHT